MLSPQVTLSAMTELFAGRQATGWCWQRAVAVPRELLAVLAAQEATEALPPGCVSWAGRSSSGSSRCSAAPGLRALGRFADAGWQDLRAVHDSRGPCSERGPFLARYSRGVFSNGGLRGFSDAWRAYPAKASSFRMHGVRILPGRGDFPVRGHFRDTWSAKLATD